MKFRGRDFMFSERLVSLSQGTRYREGHSRKLNRAEQTRQHGFDSSLLTSNRGFMLPENDVLQIIVAVFKKNR